MSARCSSCRAEIFWANSAKGFPSPIDLLPTNDGNIIVTQPNDPREPPEMRVLKKAERVADFPIRYVSHFVTCPNADQHRKAR